MAASGRDYDQSPALWRRPSRSSAMTTFSMEVFDSEIVPSSLQYSIAPILCIAAEIQNERPRVAYLCVLDLILNFRGYLRWKFTDFLRNILKIMVSLAWSIILPACYVH